VTWSTTLSNTSGCTFTVVEEDIFTARVVAVVAL
jgi:hypothetical protein